MGLTRAIGEALPELEVVGLDLLPPPGPPDLPANVTYAHYDGFRMPYPDGHFDAALAAAVLHHVESPAAALREMLRVTRLGGDVIVLDDSYRHAPRRLALHAEHVVRSRLLGIPTGRLNFQSESDWEAILAALPVQPRAATWVRPFSYLLEKRLLCLVKVPEPGGAPPPGS
jgi:SAM-dependent methyltransferase